MNKKKYEKRNPRNLVSISQRTYDWAIAVAKGMEEVKGRRITVTEVVNDFLAASLKTYIAGAVNPEASSAKKMITEEDQV